MGVEILSSHGLSLSKFLIFVGPKLRARGLVLESMQIKNNSREVVLSYVKALDNQDYEAAENYLNDCVRIRGPSGESFGKPKDFIEMLRQYRGKYDLKKVFVDGDDVCLLYDLATAVATVFMCSWYEVRGGKITSIRTIFDPSPFAPTSLGNNLKE